MRSHRRIVGRFTMAAAIAVLLVTIAPWPGARAATTITVNTTADDVDALAADGICATAAGKCSLRAAVQTVDALGYGNKIVIPAGTFTLTQPFAANDLAAVNGDLDIVGSQTITGAGRGKTIIEGGLTVNDAVDRVFDVRTDSATVTFSGMTIRNGHGVNFGGGISVSATAVVTLTDVSLTGNRAEQSGAGISGQGQLVVTGSVISGNVARSASGIDWGGNLTVKTTTVSGNTSTNALASGAIRFRRVASAPASTLIIDSSLIAGNTAPVAAAVSIGEGSGDTSSAFIRNSTVTGNTASDPGASVILVTTPAQLAFESATVASNASTAVKGPKSAITAKNSLFSRNGAKSCLGPITSLGHNLDGGTSCGLGGTGDMSNTNPRLAALGSYGGPTKTMALASNSPAIDAGAGCPSRDQRGQSRPKDGDGDGVKTCDIGAYERKAVPVVATPSPSPTATAIPSPSPVITAAPSEEPSLEPTVAPTVATSVAPTVAPTGVPTPVATPAPVSAAASGDGPGGIVLVAIGLVAVLVLIGALVRRRSSANPGAG